MLDTTLKKIPTTEMDFLLDAHLQRGRLGGLATWSRWQEGSNELLRPRPSRLDIRWSVVTQEKS